MPPEPHQEAHRAYSGHCEGGGQIPPTLNDSTPITAKSLREKFRSECMRPAWNALATDSVYRGPKFCERLPGSNLKVSGRFTRSTAVTLRGFRVNLKYTMRGQQMKPTGDKLASYIRVSSDKQDTQRQRDSVAQWAQSVALPMLFKFEDSEGRNPRDLAAKRPQFQALLKAVEAGEVDTIIVDSQDRFGTKDAHEFGKFVSLLNDNGCELWSVSQGLLSATDDATILTTTIGALTSSREQKEKAARNLSGKIIQAKQGIYQGGYSPYGTDVVCIGADGREKWRVFFHGHFKRWKIFPDGTREAFDGKGNFPSKDPTDTLRLRPTIDKERIATVKQIFEWYATENISPGQIAERLNALGSRNMVGKYWHKTVIRPMLAHPVYLGFPAYNKTGQSRFREYINGQHQDVKTKKGNRFRKRDAADFVMPEKPEFAPFVSQEVFDKCQAKLAVTDSRFSNRRPAATADMWLKSFLYCGKCGLPMRANSRTAGLDYASFTCGNYGSYGRNNPTGCRCHRVRADVIETLVSQYLEEVAPQVSELLDATDDCALFGGVFDRLLESVAKRNQLHAQMRQVAADWNPLRGMLDSYGAAFMRKRPDIEKQIAGREETLDEMLEGFRNLSPALQQRANRRMEALQSEIDALNAQLVDLRMPWDSVCREVQDRADALTFAGETLEREGVYRQKGEALRGVIDKIVCHFSYSSNSGKALKDRSRLESVEILPVSGRAIKLPLETSPGHVDHDAIRGADEAAVDHRTLDAMDTFLHRGFRQADENRLWDRAGRDIDFHLHRQRVNAHQRERL
jgi:DNA invertase Pin-like site-specific DNA recombinase